MAFLCLGSQAVEARVRLPEPPVVVFQAETEVGRRAAARCAEIWADRGPEMAAALLPVGARGDSVLCLVLETGSFQTHFAGRLPDWGVGVALPGGRLVAVDHSRMPAVGRGVEEIFLHEMVHALLFQGSEGAWLPTWLHEGTAMWFSGEWRFRDTVSLALEGRVPRLGRLQGPFPTSAAGADRAYRTSLLAVERLRRRFGETIVRDLVLATARTGNFPSAFEQVTGEPPERFAADFEGAMQLKFGWLVLLTRWPALFVLMAVIFALGAVAKIIRTRRRLADMPDD